MIARGVRRFGGLDALEELTLDDPRPVDGEVVVAVDAVGVDPADHKIAAATHNRVRRLHELPFVPGWGIAGTVVARANDVTGVALGDAVLARIDLERQGGYAQLVALPASHLVRRPGALDVATASAIPVAGVTAWQSVHDHGRIAHGQRVLVTGGAGGVGHFAVQLAVQAGAWVAATASARNHHFLRDLGVDFPIDYQTDEVGDVLADNPVNLVIDTVGGKVTESCLPALQKGGRLVSPAGFPDAKRFAAHGITAARMSTKTDAADLGELVALVMDGRLHVEIEQIYDLADVASAWRRSMGGHVRGKLVLRVNQPEQSDD